MPSPVPIVLYNGVWPWLPEWQSMGRFFHYGNSGFLTEMKYRVININYGKQHPILKSSPRLEQYAILIDQIVKANATKVPGGINQVIDYCIANDILTDFLKEEYNDIKTMIRDEENQAILNEISLYLREYCFAENIAKAMLRGKLSTDFVSETTGFPVEYLNNLENLESVDLTQLKDTESYEEQVRRTWIKAEEERLLAKGRLENALENAKTMKSLGDSDEKIMMVTGLSKEQIDSL